MVRLRFYAAGVAIATWLSSSFIQARAASFDCKKAQTSREILVCSDKDLRTADTELDATFDGFWRLLSPAAATLVEADQAEWLSWLDRVCPANPGGVFAHQNDCLEARYSERQAAFARGIYRSPEGQLFYMRSRFIFLPGTTDNSSGPSSPGFGSAHYEWPQIDAPDSNAQNWNHAVLAAAVRFVGGSKAKRLDAAYSDAGGMMSLDYRVDAANHDFVAVSFLLSRYGNEIAYPQTGYETFLYWPGKRRECRPEDLFQTGSPWKARVYQLATAKLKAMDEENGIWTGYKLRKGVESNASNIKKWSPSRKALEITFGLSAVAPYSSGLLSVNLLWTELRTVLDPTFEPEALPLPAPQPAEEIEY